MSRASLTMLMLGTATLIMFTALFVVAVVETATPQPIGISQAVGVAGLTITIGAILQYLLLRKIRSN